MQEKKKTAFWDYIFPHLKKQLFRKVLKFQSYQTSNSFFQVLSLYPGLQECWLEQPPQTALHPHTLKTPIELQRQVSLALCLQPTAENLLSSRPVFDLFLLKISWSLNSKSNIDLCEGWPHRGRRSDGLVKSVVKRMDLYHSWGSSVCNISVRQFVHVHLLVHKPLMVLLLTIAPSPLPPGQIAFSQQNSIMDLVQFFVTFFRWVTQASIRLQRDLMLCLFSFPTVSMSRRRFHTLSTTTTTHPPLHTPGALLEPFTSPFSATRASLKLWLFLHKMGWNMINMVSVRQARWLQ